MVPSSRDFSPWSPGAAVSGPGGGGPSWGKDVAGEICSSHGSQREGGDGEGEGLRREGRREERKQTAGSGMSFQGITPSNSLSQIRLYPSIIL